MDAFGGTAASVIGIVCLWSLSLVSVVALLSLLVLWGGSLEVWFCLSDPRAALVRNSGVIGVSVAAVLIWARMNVLVCRPDGRSFGAAVGLVLSAPQGTIAQRGSGPADTLVRWAMCCAAVPLQDQSNRFPK